MDVAGIGTVSQFKWYALRSTARLVDLLLYIECGSDRLSSAEQHDDDQFKLRVTAQAGCHKVLMYSSGNILDQHDVTEELRCSGGYVLWVLPRLRDTCTVCVLTGCEWSDQHFILLLRLMRCDPARRNVPLAEDHLQRSETVG